jgi:hypothetical protein
VRCCLAESEAARLTSDGKRGLHTVIRWNFRSYGASRVDGIGAEGRRSRDEVAIGPQFLFVGGRLYRNKIDTMAPRGCNQPTSTHSAPERFLSLRSP